MIFGRGRGFGLLLRWRARAVVGLTAAAVLLGMGLVASSATANSPSPAQAATAPTVPKFNQTSIAATAGAALSLHWAAQTGVFYVFTSPAPYQLPGLGRRLSWPSPGASYNGTSQSWTTNATAVTIAIPATAVGGTMYDFQVSACTSVSCSASTQTTVTVATTWVSLPYAHDFQTVKTFKQATGDPVDVSVQGGTIWTSSEFSSSIGSVAVNSDPTSVSETTDPNDLYAKPFAQCFSSPCVASSTSALDERIIAADGLMWFTQGGWSFYPSDQTAPNHSQIVAYNPVNRAFCNYLVPGNDNEVMGMTATGSGSGTTIWFVESANQGHPALDSFSPARVGSACPNNYALAGAPSFRSIAWTRNDLPAMITPDPDGQRLWVTGFFGSSVDEFTLATGAITPFSLPSTNSNSFFGAGPWQVKADANFVYAINYLDDNLVRIDKRSGHIDEVQIPVTSDTEEGYGLAMTNGRLYFSLADDGQPAFGAASTIGFVDIASWEAASLACPAGFDCAPRPSTARVYTGLDATTDPTAKADFRGIDVNAQGQLGVADLHSVVWLSPS